MLHRLGGADVERIRNHKAAAFVQLAKIDALVGSWQWHLPVPIRAEAADPEINLFDDHSKIVQLECLHAAPRDAKRSWGVSTSSTWLATLRPPCGSRARPLAPHPGERPAAESAALTATLPAFG
jgi:hypothetical protein